MHATVLDAATDADAVVMTAAVADYRPAAPADKKLRKTAGPRTLELVRNPDILAELGEKRTGDRPVLVGFAAETGDPVASAKEKRRRKKVDLVVGNDVTAPDAGFASGTNRVVFVDDDVEALPLMSKTAVAERIVDWVADRLEDA